MPRRKIAAPLLLLMAMALSVLSSGCAGPSVPGGSLGMLVTDLPHNRLDFPNPTAGQSVERMFTLRNPRDRDVTITALRVLDSPPGVFTLLDPPTLPLTLSARHQQSVPIRVRFQPSERQNYVGRLVLTSPDADNADDEGHFTIALRNATLHPEPQLSCDGTLSFGAVRKGQSKTLSCTLRNTGPTALVLQGVTYRSDQSTAQDFAWMSPRTFPLRVAPGDQEILTVAYTPSDLSPADDQGTFVLASNTKHSLTLKVQGTALPLEVTPPDCELKVTPRSHRFRSTKPPLTVTVENTGSEPCTLKSVALKSGGKDSPFALLSTPSSNKTLAPNARLDFLVNFNPKNDREWKDAVVLTSNDRDEPVIEIELVGMAEADWGLRCRLKTTPSRLVFGHVSVDRSKTLSLAIANEGWGDCRLTSLTIQAKAPANHTAFQLASQVQFPLNIQAGSQVQVEVTYAPPPGSSAHTGTLTIQSNDRTNPTHQVQLTGQTGLPCLEILSDSLDFGSTRFGCAMLTRSLEAFHIGANHCPTSLHVTKIALAQGTTPEFRLMSAPPVPHTLTAGKSLTLKLSYKPKAVGVDRGALELATNAKTQPLLRLPLVGEGISTNEQKDVFHQLRRPLSDILFVIDNSSSMAVHQDSLAKNFKSFSNWAVRLNVDYHILVTTTDVSGVHKPAGCAHGTPPFVTPNTPDPIATIQTNIKVGTQGSAKEQGLEAAYRALTPPATTGCNKGFYREKASLRVIIVSDETDQSPQSVQFYSSFLRNLKGFRNRDQINVSVVVGPPPNGCKSPTVAAAGAPRYWQIAGDFRGTQASICHSDWHGTHQNLVVVAFGFRTQFFLSRPADPKTIVVKVNGTPSKQDPQNGWRYDTASNMVEFSKNQLPPPGATIQIDYKALCLP